MQSIRDAATLLIMILLVASVRVGPSNGAPATETAEPVAESSSLLPAMRWTSPPPSRDGQTLDFDGEEGQDEILPMEAERDRKLQARSLHYPTDPVWQRKARS